MTAAVKNSNITKLIKFIIMLVLIIGIGMMDPVGDITPLGMKILGVFVGTLFGWMFIDFVVTSIVGMMCLGLSGYASILEVFQAGLSDSVVLYMIMSFAFVAFLNALNLTGALASWILTRKFAKGHPWRIVGLLFFSAWLMSALADNLSSTLIIWSVAYKIMDDVGYKRRGKDVGYILTGIIFFAQMGNYLFPFKPGVIMFAGGYTTFFGDIPQGQWYFGYFVVIVMFFALYLFMGKLVRFDVSKLKIDLADFVVEAKWDKRKIWGLVFLAFFVVFLAAPSFLPAVGFIEIWAQFGVVGTVVIIVAASYFITVDKKPLIEKPGILWTDGVAWDLVFMIAATMPIGAALRCEEGGVLTTVMGALESSIGSMNWVFFTIVCMIALGLLTQVSHNLIIAAVLFPVFAPLCAELGGDPLLWFIINFFAINAAFFTPAASGTAAMLHANEWMTVKFSYGFGGSTLIITWIGCLALIPVWLLVF